jgi:dTDP-4-amino-4,6-dideoxygalactose transaminase
MNFNDKENSRIWLSSPHMSGKELGYIQEAFDSNWISPVGPNIDALEKEIQEFLGQHVYAAVLSSGTAAIHLGLILLGVQPGDEVVCQSMTFAASANPISYVGATPVFVDSEEDTWNMSPELLEEAINDRMKKGKKPKAIIVVDLYGKPAKLKEITSIAEKYAIPLLEDAAEALGSELDGRKCGTFGAVAVLSFNGNKIITTSGGGAIISKNEELIRKARFLSTQARDPAPHYQHSHIGYNYRMSNISAGIGRGQMQVIDERVKQRRSNYAFYKSSLSAINGVKFPVDVPGHFSNHWLTTILVDPSLSGTTSDRVRQELEEENIECRPLWKPLHLQPVFAGSPYYGKDVSEKLFGSGLCLPSGSNITSDNLKTVAKKIRDAIIERKYSPIPNK